MLNNWLNTFIGADLLYQWNSVIRVNLNGIFSSSFTEENWREVFGKTIAGQKHEELRFLPVYFSASMSMLNMLSLVI